MEGENKFCTNLIKSKCKSNEQTDNCTLLLVLSKVHFVIRNKTLWWTGATQPDVKGWTLTTLCFFAFPDPKIFQSYYTIELSDWTDTCVPNKVTDDFIYSLYQIKCYDHICDTKPESFYTSSEKIRFVIMNTKASLYYPIVHLMRFWCQEMPQHFHSGDWTLRASVASDLAALLFPLLIPYLLFVMRHIFSQQC